MSVSRQQDPGGQEQGEHRQQAARRRERLVEGRPVGAAPDGPPERERERSREQAQQDPPRQLPGGGAPSVLELPIGTDETSDLLKAAGVQMVRYPGGSYADIYHWADHTAPGGYVAPNTDFDTFMAGARRIGAQPMIIANYGTGTPEEAADWVRYANVTKGYGAKYWTVGNENYGNGHYGSSWEADNHPDKSATYYANLVVDYADAMKAVDPTIKVGAVLTMPGQLAGRDNRRRRPGTVEPGPSSPSPVRRSTSSTCTGTRAATAAESLARTSHLDDAMYLLRQQINRYAGADAARIGISFTELNIDIGRNTQPGALFLADAYSGLLEQGVFTAQWWNVHNGIGTRLDGGRADRLRRLRPALQRHLHRRRVGLRAGAEHPVRAVPRAVHDDMFAHPGDQFVRAGTDQPLVTAHAVRRPQRRSRGAAGQQGPGQRLPGHHRLRRLRPVERGAEGLHPTPTAPPRITSSQSGSATSRTLPPYSLTTLVLRPAGAVTGAPGAPGQPTASAVTDRAATISWPAATPGASPIAKYEVYRQFGTISEQLGETSGTSLTVGNLNPGSRYTVNVVTRDTAGRVSWASPPLTFTTGSPATSGCAVRFTYTADWGNGYVGNVDIVNNGAEPVDGWTLDLHLADRLAAGEQRLERHLGADRQHGQDHQ